MSAAPGRPQASSHRSPQGEGTPVSNPNLAILELVAQALGPVCEEVVFVGGCAAGLLLTQARPTAFGQRKTWISWRKRSPCTISKRWKNGCERKGSATT
jgi:hypothetical protein